MITGKQLYRFQELDFNEINKQDVIGEFQSRSLDGIVIHNVLNELERKKILKFLNELEDGEQIIDEICSTYPIGFGAAANLASKNEKELDNYFKSASKFQKSITEKLDFDIIARLQDVFNKISLHSTFSLTQINSINKTFLPGQFRRIFANKPGFPVHCGNAFENLYNQFYETLKKEVKTFNQFSYFLVIQNPEEGGELSLYNKEWVEGQSMKSYHEFLDENGVIIDTIHEKNIGNVMKIKPPAGSLLTFVGGEIWHKVEPSLGAEDRITFGGFYGKSNKDNEHCLFA